MKFKHYLILAVLASLTACGQAPSQKPADPLTNVETVQHCTTLEERKALGEFIIACAAAANPKSDEEGEDLVAQCETSGRNAICPTHHHRRFSIDTGGVRWVDQEVDEFGHPLSTKKDVVDGSVEPEERVEYFYDEEGNAFNAAGELLDPDGRPIPKKKHYFFAADGAPVSPEG